MDTTTPSTAHHQHPSSGDTATAPKSKLEDVTAPAVGHIPFTPKTKKVIEGSLRQTALLGHEEIGTDHLLLALFADPASTGAHILTDLVSLSKRAGERDLRVRLVVDVSDHDDSRH
ncbi:Clp protease N-terminal domain-containing protein [Rhodococcus koreensis]|uniref:Clp protease N-terminal domain-containing protein n=1 Tax=Rhodococcus koreensis TaxID=99653 RepID=UPI001F124AAD|nr:Clp protease N-terminal domain-containing protein [Rhodococcus koreensis]